MHSNLGQNQKKIAVQQTVNKSFVLGARKKAQNHFFISKNAIFFWKNRNVTLSPKKIAYQIQGGRGCLNSKKKKKHNTIWKAFYILECVKKAESTRSGCDE